MGCNERKSDYVSGPRAEPWELSDPLYEASTNVASSVVAC